MLGGVFGSCLSRFILKVRVFQTIWSDCGANNFSAELYSATQIIKEVSYLIGLQKLLGLEQLIFQYTLIWCIYTLIDTNLALK